MTSRKKMKLYPLYFLLILLSFSTSANDETDINSQFKDAYQQFNYAVSNNDKAKQLEYAELSYQLATKIYQESDINLANLAINLANQYIKHYQFEKAEKLLMPIVKIYKRKYDKNALEFINLYFSLAQSKTYSEVKSRERYFQKAIDIAEFHSDKNPMLVAELQLEAAHHLLLSGSNKSKMILEAQAFFQQHLKPEDTRLLRANFIAGKYHLAKRKLDKAINSFKQSIDTFEQSQGPTHPLELTTRAFLVESLEKEGRSDEATEHCIAIGKMTPWDESQKPVPLYRIGAKYPLSMITKRREGFVKIKFTLSKNGFVTAATVIDSAGGKIFENSALSALKKWRYAPKFENGVAVEVPDQTVTLDFALR